MKSDFYNALKVLIPGVEPFPDKSFPSPVTTLTLYPKLAIVTRSSKKEKTLAGQMHILPFWGYTQLMASSFQILVFPVHLKRQVMVYSLSNESV